ncbi:hypothetical protein INT44_006524 [Umbelopsis vinacea]|uniref:Prokaryotic-type class I peptide chain release factors domain-containing protein n=1 Tax=Umbelopsis vinacea TaxID=44442 RepID=A0A8H7UBQ2_9FUNG|nr:hypothetical protein INT44_006524 [Umbelopsis vinacea]
MQPYLSTLRTSLLRNGTFHTPLITPSAKLLPIPSFLLPRLYASKVPRAADGNANTESAAQRQKIVLNDDDLIETFVRGSGPGGQCINKRSNCVDLRHIPTGLRVQCQQTRSLAQNRGIARKLLIGKLDDRFNGTLSKNAVKAKKIAKGKKRQMKRAKEKYGAKPALSTTSEDGMEGQADIVEDEEDPYEEVLLEEVGCIRHNGIEDPVVDKTNLVST